ncbi:hypothetical protein HQ560_18385, partial [bacterium]|nr:hypothetical protein [bacterium]
AYKERPWFALLAARAATRREQVVAACLGRLAWDDGVPAPLDDGVRAHWRQAFEFFASWRAEAGRLAATLGTLERALDNCTQLDEAPPGAAGTVDALLTVWEKRSILQRDAELERAAETTVRRVAALRSVAASTDRTALADQARAALAARQSGIALAAWRRLRGLAPPWPDTADEFTKDADFEARLTSMLVSLEDTERSRVLREQVGRDGLVRRGRALDRLVALVVATGDPVLARLGPLVTARKAALAKQDLKAAVSDVEALTRLARRLSDRVATDRMDRALFAAEGAVYRAEPGPDALEQWLREADGYVRLAPDDAVAKAHAGLVAREKALRQAIAGVAEERRTPLLAQLDEKVAPVTRLSAVRKNREALAAAAPDAEKTLSALGAGLELETRVARLEYELRKGAADVARESGDPVLARLSDYVEAEIQTASAKAPQERADALEALAQFGAELATFVRGDWQEKIDRKAFAAAVELPAGQPTRKTFTDWVEQARAFQYLDAEDDPRGRRATWEARRAALGTAIDRLARHGDAGKETAATWEGRLEREAWPRVQAMLDVSWIAQNRVVVAERLKAAQADVAAVDALIRAQETWFAERAALDRDLTDLAAYGEAEKQKAAAWRTRLADEGGPKARSVLDAAWSADALPGLAGRAGEAAAFLRSMRQEIAGVLETPAQFVERAAQTAPASRSAALRSEWTRWRDRVLQLHTQAALEADRARYARVRERFRALSAFLEGLDDAQALPPGLPATALPEGARQAAERAVAAAREA